MKKSICLLSVAALAHSAQAASPIQLSLTPDIAILDQGATVEGLALNVWGDNEVQGVDLGLVNQLSGDSYGFSWALLGTTAGDFKGILWGGLFVQTTGDVVGWQAGLININQGSMTGFQSGFVNIADDMTGLQLGLINYTKKLNGIQIGLANIVESNPWFTEAPEKLAMGFPIINWSF